MRRGKTGKVLLVCFCLTLSGWVQAHIPFVEPEALVRDPAALSQSERDEQDYSFHKPFPFADDESFSVANGFAFDGVDSMVVSGYLLPGDVDVFRMVAAENAGFVFPAIMASVLTPACAELVDSYPLVALVGPGLPREPDVLAVLPFDIDDETLVPQPPTGQNGAIYAPNPMMERREFFIEDELTGLAWFLPKGLTQECLMESDMPFLECETFENTIVATEQGGMILGQAYSLAIWDPAGKAQDYTMNIGVTDDHYVDRPDVNAIIECSNLLHGECSVPYPEFRPPDGYFSPLCQEKESKSSSGCSLVSASSGAGGAHVVLALLGFFVVRRRAGLFG